MFFEIWYFWRIFAILAFFGGAILDHIWPFFMKSGIFGVFLPFVRKFKFCS